MRENISVRQWQELYRSGAFEPDNRDARGLAGWSDFDEPMNNRRLKSLCRLAPGVSPPFLLGN